MNNINNCAFFFDMDGVLFNSMPFHAKAWAEVMAEHGLHFTQQDCYIDEGRTGQDVIDFCIQRDQHRQATQEEIWAIYREKTERFHAQGEVKPIPGVQDVLNYLHTNGAQIWVVTGSGQKSLLDRLNALQITNHQSPITNHKSQMLFSKERLITAYDVTHGKPDPEPYLKAWERSGLNKNNCFVIENAPLGVRSGKAAGLTVLAVNTGPLPDSVFYDEKTDHVFPDMSALLNWLKQ